MSFFDTTPLGRILNRFSKDIDIIDITIPMILRGLISQLLVVLGKKYFITFLENWFYFSLVFKGTILIVCYANPLFIAVMVPILVIYYFLQKFYVATARYINLKKVKICIQINYNFVARYVNCQIKNIFYNIFCKKIILQFEFCSTSIVK